MPTSQAKIIHTSLSCAKLIHASLADADVTDFANATVTGAYFDDYDGLSKDATLTGVDFEHARFGSAK
jgi:uncharacterized protein YjbI with pentapeptide repeats